MTKKMGKNSLIKVMSLVVALIGTCQTVAFSDTDHSELRRELKGLFKQQKFEEAYVLLRNANIDKNIDLLRERAGLYFLQGSRKYADKCDAVDDYEKIAHVDRWYANSFLDLLYNGAWIPIAAYEGNIVARILLVKKSIRSAQNKEDTLKKLNPALYYTELLSFLELNGSKTVNNDILKEMEILKKYLHKNMLKNGISIKDIYVNYIEPRKILCNPRVVN